MYQNQFIKFENGNRNLPSTLILNAYPILLFEISSTHDLIIFCRSW